MSPKGSCWVLNWNKVKINQNKKGGAKVALLKRKIHPESVVSQKYFTFIQIVSAN